MGSPRSDVGSRRYERQSPRGFANEQRTDSIRGGRSMSVGRLGRRPRRRRATAAVELAVVLPLILTMLIGLWEVSRVVECQQILFNAAREAARQAATGQYTNTQVQQVALAYLRI